MNRPFYDISPVQAAMLRESLSAGAGHSLEQVEITFKKGVRREQIKSAWEEMVASVEVMRMGFVFANGEPVGWRGEMMPNAMEFIDTEVGVWSEWLERERLKRLALEGACPWRVTFCEVEGKLLWSFHHSLLDGRSVARIVRHFLARLGDEEEFVPLGLSCWNGPSAEEVEAARAYHHKAFAEVEARQPEFPHAGEGGRSVCTKFLGGSLLEALERVASEVEVTVATLVTWGWGQALMTAAGAPAVVVGQVRAGPPVGNRAGFTMNTLPLVLRRDPSQNVVAEIKGLRHRMLEMRAIERVSPGDLRLDLFQELGGPWPCGLLMVESGTMEHQCGRHAMVESIKLHENSGEALIASAYLKPDLQLEIEVDGSLYERAAAEALLAHWAQILGNLAHAMALSHEEITRLPGAMTGLLDAWEDGGEAVRWSSVTACWKEAVAKFPEQVALWMPERAFTYREVAAMADALAMKLRVAGVVPGMRVALILRERRHLAVAILGIAQAGAVYVPLDPLLPKQRQATIVSDSQAYCLATDEEAMGAEFDLPFVLLDDEMAKEEFPACEVDGDGILALLYTSGSTGVPKAVMMHHGGVVNEALVIAGKMQNGAGERLLQFASAGFDASLEEIFSTLLSGGTLVPRPDEVVLNFEVFHEFLDKAAITLLDLTTAFWAAWCAWMVTEGKRLPGCLRCTIIGGERLSAVALGHWKQATGGAVLLNSYGPTEASIVATLEVIDFSQTGAGDPPLGRPLPAVRARVADANGRRVTAGAAGELWLGGKCVSPGYWNNEVVTRKVFKDIDGQRWYRTGDRCHWDASGRLCFMGRADDQLKIRGQRVDPAETIRLLESYPGVSAAHVAGYVAQGEMVLAAWLCWTEEPPEDALANVSAFLRDRLPTAYLPVRWAHVREFKLTERGKLDRKALPPADLTLCSNATYQAAENATEVRLIEFFGELLGEIKIGRDDSFFALGGHSLAALRLFAKISREWQVRLPMGILLEAATPALLAEQILAQIGGKDLDREGAPRFLTIRKEGKQVPLFCIHGGDGGVVFYRNLAEHFAGDRPLVAIEAPALGASEDCMVGTVEETATLYIEALKKRQLNGPYYLAGYSFGGLVAYEMAKQMREQGDEIGFCGLFDTQNPAMEAREYRILERAEVYWNSQKRMSLGARLTLTWKRMREGTATHFRVKREMREARATQNSEPHSDVRLLKVRDAHWQAMTEYRPGRFNGEVTLYSVLNVNDKFELPEDYGWGEMVKNLQIVKVPGEHLTMFSARHVAELGKEISRRIG